jgi:cell shape-determining protein MreD
MVQRIALLALTIAAAAALDGAWLSRVLIGSGADLVVVIVVLVALRYGVEAGAVFGAAAGYVEDLVSGAPLGLYTLLFVLLGATGGALRPVVDLQQRSAPLAAAVLATFLVWGLSALLADVLHFGVVVWRADLGDLLTAAAVNGALALPVAGILAWIDRVTQRRYSGRTIGERGTR